MALRALNREPRTGQNHRKGPPSVNAMSRVEDGKLLRLWQKRTFQALKELKASEVAHKSLDSKNWAAVAGIGTEKVLLLGGRPTEIVSHLHEMRHTLPDIVGRLIKVAKVKEIFPNDPKTPSRREASGPLSLSDISSVSEPYPIGDSGPLVSSSGSP